MASNRVRINSTGNRHDRGMTQRYVCFTHLDAPRSAIRSSGQFPICSNARVR